MFTIPDLCGLHHNLDSESQLDKLGRREKKQKQYVSTTPGTWMCTISANPILKWKNPKWTDITPQRSDCTLPGAHTEGLQVQPAYTSASISASAYPQKMWKRKQHQSLWRPKAQNPQLAAFPLCETEKQENIKRSESRKLKISSKLM